MWEASQIKALDLFCGLGGWSDGLALEGFDILGVEIEPHIAKLYKHPIIVSDVRDLNPEDFKGYDLIVGSPPCRDFISWFWRVEKMSEKKPYLVEIKCGKCGYKFKSISNMLHWVCHLCGGVHDNTLDASELVKTVVANGGKQ